MTDSGVARPVNLGLILPISWLDVTDVQRVIKLSD